MKNDLNVRCVLSKDVLPVMESEQVVYSLIDIKAKSGTAVEGMPANLAFVLDRSGSMDGDKMENLKEAVGYAVDHLRDHDLVSVTIFDDQVDTLIKSQPAIKRDEIKATVSEVIARGGTQISDGLKAGLAEVMRGYSKEHINRIVLLTDGQTWDDEDTCLRLADEAAKWGIAITSIGLGDEWNERLLLQIAERSNGNSHWIQSPVEILDVFRQEVEGTQSIAAVNLKLTVSMSPGVRPFKMFSTIPMIKEMTKTAVNDSTVSLDIGALDGEKGQAILIESRVPAQKAGAFRLGQVEVIYDVPSRGINAQSVRTDLMLAFSEDSSSSVKVNAEVMNLVEKVSAFKLQTRALTEAEAGNIASATRKLQAAATILLRLGEDQLAETAEQEILGLKKTGALSAAGTKKLEYGTRKLTQVMTKAMTE